MKQSFSILTVFLASVVAAHSQPPAGVPPGGRPGRAPAGPQYKAVEVHEDHTVTFKFNAPTAKEIMLVANFLPEPLALTKDDKGLFSATTAPLEPAIYHYHYTIDGVRGIDPHRSNW